MRFSYQTQITPPAFNHWSSPDSIFDPIFHFKRKAWPTGKKPRNRWGNHTGTEKRCILRWSQRLRDKTKGRGLGQTVRNTRHTLISQDNDDMIRDILKAKQIARKVKSW